MSQENIQVKIRNNPKFTEMVGKRTRFAIILSLVVLVPYYSYMLLVSLQPQLFAAKISEGSVITIGWPIAALIVVIGWPGRFCPNAAPRQVARQNVLS